jgi:hypothetical protein
MRGQGATDETQTVATQTLQQLREHVCRGGSSAVELEGKRSRARTRPTTEESETKASVTQGL